MSGVRAVPVPLLMVFQYRDEPFTHRLVHVLLLDDQPGSRITCETVRSDRPR